MATFNVQNSYGFGNNTVAFGNRTSRTAESGSTIWDSQMKQTQSKPVTKPTDSVKPADAQKIKQAKVACESDLQAFQKAGVSVSGWDDKNSCTLSYNGKTATITLDNSGKPQFSGDFEYMMKHLQESDNQEKQSIENYNNFIKTIKSKGDEFTGQKIVTTKVDGKDTPLIEFTIQSKDGQQYKSYLDDAGNQITPDK